MEVIGARRFHFSPIVHYLELWSFYVCVLSLIEVFVTHFVPFIGLTCVGGASKCLISPLKHHIELAIAQECISAIIGSTYCSLGVH